MCILTLATAFFHILNTRPWGNRGTVSKIPLTKTRYAGVVVAHQCVPQPWGRTHHTTDVLVWRASAFEVRHTSNRNLPGSFRSIRNIMQRTRQFRSQRRVTGWQQKSWCLAPGSCILTCRVRRHRVKMTPDVFPKLSHNLCCRVHREQPGRCQHNRESECLFVDHINKYLNSNLTDDIVTLATFFASAEFLTPWCKTAMTYRYPSPY